MSRVESSNRGRECDRVAMIGVLCEVLIGWDFKVHPRFVTFKSRLAIPNNRYTTMVVNSVLGDYGGIP